MDHPLIIRGSLGKQALLALGGLIFVIVGLLMLILPPPAHSLFGWSSPAGGVAQAIVGVLAVLFGAAAFVMAALAASRPILLLHPDRLVDVPRRLTVHFTEIREIKAAGGSTQWLLLQMRDPGKFADFERLSKQTGLNGADLTLNLSLASASDFEKARQFIAGRIG